MNGFLSDMELLSKNAKIKSRDKAIIAMRQGVHIIDPDRIDIRGELICKDKVTIDINVIIEGVVTIDEGSTIGAHCILKNCSIGAGTNIYPYSIVEDSIIGNNSFVGPYGRIRPKCEIGNEVQVGNFVEIKASKIGNQCKINHLSFVGDAELADNVTLGAGTITCNYNGAIVNTTKIGKDAFIGSGCNLIAPLEVGDKAMIGAGSTITKYAPKGQLTLARAKQVTIESWQGFKK